jgi:hypothetical protein
LEKVESITFNGSAASRAFGKSHETETKLKRKRPKNVLAQLKARRFKCAILSNGSPNMLTSAIENASIQSLLDAVLSVEDVQVYKPRPAVYQLAKDDLFWMLMRFVSFHPTAGTHTLLRLSGSTRCGATGLARCPNDSRHSGVGSEPTLCIRYAYCRTVLKS